MSALDTSTSLGDFVTAQPNAAELFDRLGFDFCCGGDRSLRQAATERGLDAETVLVMLRSLADDPPRGGAAHDVASFDVAALVDHIVSEHHEPLRRDLEKIGELLDTVLRVHGPSDPQIAPLHQRFGGVREELREHMDIEERQLFPACREIAGGKADGVDEALLGELEHVHVDTGEALVAMRELAHDYDPESAHCGTHRLLLQSLAAMEADLHRHIHEENNVLFPRVREMAKA